MQASQISPISNLGGSDRDVLEIRSRTLNPGRLSRSSCKPAPTQSPVCYYYSTSYANLWTATGESSVAAQVYRMRHLLPPFCPFCDRQYPLRFCSTAAILSHGLLLNTVRISRAIAQVPGSVSPFSCRWLTCPDFPRSLFVFGAGSPGLGPLASGEQTKWKYVHILHSLSWALPKFVWATSGIPTCNQRVMEAEIIPGSFIPTCKVHTSLWGFASLALLFCVDSFRYLTFSSSSQQSWGRTQSPHYGGFAHWRVAIVVSRLWLTLHSKAFFGSLFDAPCVL